MFGNLKIYHEIQNGRYFNNSILKQKTNNKKKSRHIKEASMLCSWTEHR